MTLAQCLHIRPIHHEVLQDKATLPALKGCAASPTRDFEVGKGWIGRDLHEAVFSLTIGTTEQRNSRTRHHAHPLSKRHYVGKRT
jgi:hypothetical protein